MFFKNLFSKNRKRNWRNQNYTRRLLFWKLFKVKKRKVSKSEFYFDNFGKILEKISYGRHHFNKLYVIGNIEQYFYENDKLYLSKEYTSSCKSCDFYQFYTKYNYNENKILIGENIYYGEIDSLFMSIKYIEKLNVKETHFNQSTFNQRVFDSENRITQFNQVFEDTKR